MVPWSLETLAPNQGDLPKTAFKKNSCSSESEPRVLSRVGKCSTTELQPIPKYPFKHPSVPYYGKIQGFIVEPVENRGA